MAGEVLEVVKKFKYLRHIIRDDLCDDDDVQHQCCKLYGQANMLAPKFHVCTEDVKIALFKTALHSIQPTCGAAIAMLK